MKNIIQELRNLGRRVAVPNSGLILPGGQNGSPKPDFKVEFVICTHRDVKVQVFDLMTRLLPCKNPKIIVKTGVGDALIDRSRSIMATRFLEGDADILWFWDDDVVSNTMDVTQMMWDMWKHDLDVYGAPYPLKSDGPDKGFAVRPIEDKCAFVAGKGGEIHEIMYLSTGCMGIRRRVLEKMVKEQVVHYCHPDTRKFYPFFMPMEKQINNNWLYLSEDWAFCQRARDLGFKIHCNFGIKLGHIGSYEYTFDDWFREPKKKLDGCNYNVDIKRE